MKKRSLYLCIAILIFFSCNSTTEKAAFLQIQEDEYKSKLYGFWLGQCIANWTGLVTEMDKIGDIGETKTGAFYTRTDWGKPDLPNIWSENPSEISETIDFVFRGPEEIWGADDDTDIEYIYQELLHTNEGKILTGEQIREGWVKHIKHEEENYLWVSNQSALDLMLDGKIPPETSDPKLNPNYEMIDAQLTTEIFGLFAPGKPDIALQYSHLPIRTTARKEAAEISEFYVKMYSLSASIDPTQNVKAQLYQIAGQSTDVLSTEWYPYKMYQYVKEKYESGIPWEACRDSIYLRYQVKEMDGYDLSSRNLPCNACFAAGINFAASLVSLFYGEGDLKETIKIGALCGWDSDNPTATWGGLLGFVYGKKGVEDIFNRTFSDRFNIHRTRVNFPGDGIDTFNEMSEKGWEITEKILTNKMNATFDPASEKWKIEI